MDDPLRLYSAACASFGNHVRAVGAHQWDAATPCDAWSVRDLVNHVTVENLWAVELFAGRTINEVGADLDGDQLGAAPVTRWDEASEAALHAMSRPGAMSDIVHLSFGDVPGGDYTLQLFADHLVHSWDLATAIGRPPALDPALVRACGAWFAGNEDAYRAAGVIAPRGTSSATDDQTRLLIAFGRTP